MIVMWRELVVHKHIKIQAKTAYNAKTEYINDSKVLLLSV